MAISHRYHTDRNKFSLELTMRDALAGLEEFAHLDVSRFDGSCMEVLAIEPPHVARACEATAIEPARLCTFPAGLRRLERDAG